MKRNPDSRLFSTAVLPLRTHEGRIQVTYLIPGSTARCEAESNSVLTGSLNHITGTPDLSSSAGAFRSQTEL